jgi:hypothetical protein
LETVVLNTFQRRELYDKLLAILDEADPIGIGIKNEYDPEVGTILPLLAQCSTVHDLECVIYEQFCRWFNVESAGPREKYQPIAVKVWELWREFNKSQA